MPDESDHKYTHTGFGNKDSAYWRKKTEREVEKKRIREEARRKEMA
jgi:hypothetical protein